MTDDLTVPRGDEDPSEAESTYGGPVGAALEEKAAQSSELAVQGPSGNEWEVYACGPWQPPLIRASMPGRIIRVDEKAYIGVVVWMNDEMCPEYRRITKTRSSSASGPPILKRCSRFLS